MRTSAYIVTVFLFFMLSVLQLRPNEPVIPTLNGRVLFTDTIKTSLDKNEIKERLIIWSDKNLKSDEQRTIMNRSNDSINNILSTMVFDYMEMDKNNWVTHFIYIKYLLTFNYQDNRCIVTFGRISYAENMRDVKDPMPGEDILLKNKYKRVGFKNASEKVREYTVKKVSALFDDIRQSIE